MPPNASTPRRSLRHACGRLAAAPPPRLPWACRPQSSHAAAPGCEALLAPGILSPCSPLLASAPAAPFALSEAAARAAFERHLSSGLLGPSGLLSHAGASLTATQLPVWVFHLDASVRFRGSVGRNTGGALRWESAPSAGADGTPHFVEQPMQRLLKRPAGDPLLQARRRCPPLSAAVWQRRGR